MFSILVPRAFELDQFVTTDEPEWLFQSANFYYALSQWDFEGTLRREHPGVIPMWAGTVSYLIHFPEYRGMGQGYLETAGMQAFFEEKGQDPLEVLKTARLIMVLITTFMLTSAFLYAARLVGTLPAFIGAMLIGYDPFHTALTRLLHLDGMAANFMLLAVLAWLSYLYLGRSWIDLTAAGAAAGFAILTKSPGAFALAFMGLWLVVAWFQDWRRDGRLDLWRKLILPGLLVVLVTFITIFLLWPAMWGQPFETLRYIFISAIGYAEQGHDGSNFFLGTIYSDGKIDWSVPHYYLVTYLWRSTPMVLLGLVLLLVAWPRRAALLEDERIRQVVIALVVYALLFWAFMNFGTKKFDRYGLAAHMALFVLSGLGWAVIAVWFQDLGGRFLQIQGPTWLLILVIGAQMFTVRAHSPYYFTYFNPLMGGAQRAPQVILVGWGEGLELAAEYLNQKPDAEDLLVMSPISYGSTSFYLEGESVPMFRIVGERLNRRKQEIVSEVDYMITYVNNWQRVRPENNLFLGIEPEHTIWLNGLEYVRIYPRSALPFLDRLAGGE